MKKYEDIRPQFADAALIYRADRDEIDTTFTLGATSACTGPPAGGRSGFCRSCDEPKGGSPRGETSYFAGGKRHAAVTSSATAIPSDTSTKR
jgi:hypothetical protein